MVAARAKLIAGEVHANGDSRANAAVIREQTDRMAKIVRQLLTFSRRDRPRAVPINLLEVASRTIEFLGEIARSRNVDLRLTGGADSSWVVTADAGQMQQVLTNLTLNAIQAMPHGGEVKIAFHQCRARRDGKPDTPEVDCIRIDVIDEGRGIAPEIIGRIFEPFFTTKDVGEGTGMGLSIAYGIVSDHGGWFDVQSKPSRGSRFSVFLPVST